MWVFDLFVKNNIFINFYYYIIVIKYFFLHHSDVLTRVIYLFCFLLFMHLL